MYAFGDAQRPFGLVGFLASLLSIVLVAIVLMLIVFEPGLRLAATGFTAILGWAAFPGCAAAALTYLQLPDSPWWIWGSLFVWAALLIPLAIEARRNLRRSCPPRLVTSWAVAVFGLGLGGLLLSVSLIVRLIPAIVGQAMRSAGL